MNSTTRPFSKIRRHAAAVVATAVVAVAGAACGTETVDDLAPAAPAQVQVPAHQPQSADSAERNAAKEHYDALKRHYMQSADSAERNGAKEHNDFLTGRTMQSADSAERNGAQ